MRISALLFLLCSITACATPQHRFKITVVRAKIDLNRPDGTAWHEAPPPIGAQIAIGFVGVALGIPRSITTLAQQVLSDRTRRFFEPSPEVWVDIRGARHHTSPLPSTLEPEWRYPFVINTKDLKRDTPIDIQVMDAADKRLLGRKQLTLAALLASSSHELKAPPSVGYLQLQVEPLPEVPRPRVYRFAIPVDQSIEQLVEHLDSSAQDTSKERWRGVQLLNGDVVRVHASGTICPGNNKSKCAGPEGFADAKSWIDDYNRTEFPDKPHAALVGYYADLAIMIGKELVFEAKRSGTLLLGVNDTDVGNNDGNITVTVEVNPPGLAETQSARPAWRAATW